MVFSPNYLVFMSKLTNKFFEICSFLKHYNLNLNKFSAKSVSFALFYFQFAIFLAFFVFFHCFTSFSYIKRGIKF